MGPSFFQNKTKEMRPFTLINYLETLTSLSKKVVGLNVFHTNFYNTYTVDFDEYVPVLYVHPSLGLDKATITAAHIYYANERLQIYTCKIMHYFEIDMVLPQYLELPNINEITKAKIENGH